MLAADFVGPLSHHYQSHCHQSVSGDCLGSQVWVQSHRVFWQRYTLALVVIERGQDGQGALDSLG